MNFNDCLSKGFIKKDPLARERVTTSFEIAHRFLSSAQKNLDINEFEMAELASYNAIFHAARLLLFQKGYIERSHLCVIIALKELYKDNTSFIEALFTFDKIRITRHNVQYQGTLVKKNEAQFVLDFAKKFLEQTQYLVKEE